MREEKHFLSSQVGRLCFITTMLSEPSGTEGSSCPGGKPATRNSQPWAWKPRWPRATPHDHALGSLCIFQTFLRLCKAVLADPENSMTSLRFNSRQRGRLSQTTVYCRPKALWFLRERGAHDTGHMTPPPSQDVSLETIFGRSGCNRCHRRGRKGGEGM